MRIPKKEIRENRSRWQEQKYKIGRQLFELRQQNGDSLQLLSHKSKIPVLILENMENGVGDLNLGNLLHLCRLYRYNLIVEIGEPYPPLEPQN